MHLNTKKIAFAGVMLALTEVGIALGSVIETNTLFLLAAASFFVGIVIQEFGLKSGAGFLLAGILLAILLSPNKLYVVSYAFMGFYILIIETIWHFSGRASGWIRSRNFFWLMKYLVFNVLYIPGLIYFWSMLSEKKTVKGIMLCLLYSDNLYFLSLIRHMNMQWGKSGKKIDINSDFKAYIIQ